MDKMQSGLDKRRDRIREWSGFGVIGVCASTYSNGKAITSGKTDFSGRTALFT